MGRRIWIGLGIGALSLFQWSCTEAPPEVFDPRTIQQLERAPAGEARRVDLQPLPTTRIDPQVSSAPRRPRTDPTAQNDVEIEPVVRMSLREIVHRAVANNHDVRVAGYQPGIEGSRVTEAQAHYDPAFFAAVQWQHKDELTGGQVFNDFSGGLLPITSDLDIENIGTLQTGVQQNLASGGQVSLQYEDTYNWFDPQRTVNNPFWTSSVSVQLTQPLLKNFGYDVNYAQITINRLTQKVSLLDFRKAVEQNVSDIEKFYWQLVQAEIDIHIEETLVAQTESTYTILFTRWKRGLDVSELQVAQAQSALESRRGQLLQFRAQARDLSDQIKALMSDPEFPISSNVLILPADPFVEAPMNFDLQNQVDTALENRLELGEQQLKIDSATVTVTVARNNLLPQLDFIGSVGPQGAASDDLEAMQKQMDFDHIDYTVGFKLQIPIGNREAKAIYRRTMLQRLQAIEQYKSLVESIAADVKINARAVDTDWGVVGLQRQARYQAETAVRAINDRERANEPLTPEFVRLKLDTQDILSQAEQAEAQAIANYNIALAALERSKGTLLKYNNVVLEEQPGDEEEGLLR